MLCCWGVTHLPSSKAVMRDDKEPKDENSVWCMIYSNYIWRAKVECVKGVLICENGNL